MSALTSGIDKIQSELDTIKTYVGMNSADDTSNHQSTVKLSASDDEDQQGSQVDRSDVGNIDIDLQQDLNLTETVWVASAEPAPSEIVSFRFAEDVQTEADRRSRERQTEAHDTLR